MSDSDHDRTRLLTSLLWWAAAALGVLVLASYLHLVFIHLGYPFEIERLEGGAVDHALRVVRGSPIYVRPGPGFIPYNYPPVYFYLASISVSMLDNGFMGARLVSVTGFAAVLFVLVFILKKKGARWPLVLAMTGILAGSARMADSAWTLARVDALAVAFIIVGACLLATSKNKAATVAAALLMAAAFFTKQNALAATAFAGLFLLVKDRKRFWIFLPAAAGAILLSLVVLEIHSGGWFSAYVLRQPVHNRFTPRIAWSFFIEDLGLLWPAAILVAGRLILSPEPVRDDKLGFVLAFDWLLLAGVVISWGARFFSGGGSLNNCLPAVVCILIFAGANLAGATESSSKAGVFWRIFVPVLLIVQLIVLGVDWGEWKPAAASEKAGRELLKELSAVEGPVLIPYHSHYAPMSGHPTTFHMVALRDTQRGGPAVQGGAALAQVLEKIEDRYYEVIVWDSIGPRIPELEDALREHYRLSKTLFQEDDYRFYTLAGVRSRPDQWWEPREETKP
jgi:hypothetical protein